MLDVLEGFGSVCKLVDLCPCSFKIFVKLSYCLLIDEEFLGLIEPPLLRVYTCHLP